ncbi:2-dehydro-3-deoxy-6-phosphogalactonate aldolase [Luteimonas sp. Y-2-2-4F]|nr:2-dehydro-3-deoxy-6-phosphogalactonate aldolase [Luteimonas sp. Y-2-2-4F]MCD9032800.1 2-dehydro-3-deoxy-6-phosphogalactonate aldolase [Luteimonas sp. Y-2-2-4F]
MTVDAPAFRPPLVAILRGIRPHEVEAHVAALIGAGLAAIEIPLNSPDWASGICHAVRAAGDAAWIGGGTVLRPEDADRLVELGARFAVTPNTRPALIRHAAARGLPVLAGCATASEAFNALEAGARMLKLFPASVYGPGLARALRAVLPPVPLYAVGGITPRNLGGFLAAGCDGAGLGGELYRAGQPPDLTARAARAFVAAWQDARP